MKPLGSQLNHVVALAGGVGGARMADGLARALPAKSLTVIVNTGDDFDHLGLRICPDLDTVCYTLAGIANPETGWGRSDETWRAIEALGELGGPVWFRLGDRDLGTHLERTRRLSAGETLSRITLDFCRRWDVGPRVLPMSDEPVATVVTTAEGDLPFQDYFVRKQCQPEVRGFRFDGADAARPAPGVLEALAQADLVVICPSNPWVSIDPILAVPGLKAALGQTPVVGVSPIIGGRAVKGPAARMFQQMGIQPSALAVARHYGPLLTGFVVDHLDEDQAEAVRALGIAPRITNTLMRSDADRPRLANEVLAFGRDLAIARPAGQTGPVASKPV